MWEHTWNNALSAMRNAISSDSTHSPHVVRVGQLDAELLDQELAQLLQEPLNEALSLINISLKTRFEPELSLLIHLTLYKLSIWDSGASYGAKLQDLRYYVEPIAFKAMAPSGLPCRTLLIHGALTLLLPYMYNRLRSHALSHAWPDAPSSDRRRKTWDLMNSLESTHSLLCSINFVAFLWNGRHRTLADRLVRMSLIPSRRLVKRNVSYEFMNRQMVWHAFTEFLIFILPLINRRTIRQRIYRFAANLSPASLLAGSPFKIRSSSEISDKNATYNFKSHKFRSLPDDQCAICAENSSFNLNINEPNNLFTTLAAPSQTAGDAATTSFEIGIPLHPIYTPYMTSCGHVYCYNCIAECMIRTADEDEGGWECLRCGEPVRGAERYIVDVASEVSDCEFSSDMDMSATDFSGSMGSYSESG